MTAVLYERKFAQGIFRVYDGTPGDLALTTVKQVHGAQVLKADAANEQTEADGIWSPWGEKTIPAIKTADCLPIALWGSEGFAMIHAGWRGLAAGILEHPSLSNIRPGRAFIGPCIRTCCFEVTAEFQQHFPHRPLITRSEKLFFDLVEEAKAQLRRTYPCIFVDDSGQCTFCESKYSSFRRDKTTRRIWNCFLPLAQ